MLHEALTVIAGNQENRFVEDATPLQLVKEPPDVKIHVRNFRGILRNEVSSDLLPLPVGFEAFVDSISMSGESPCPPFGSYMPRYGVGAAYGEWGSK